MSIEKSVLTLEEIKGLLKDRYSINDIIDIIHIDNASANCYRIICADKQYFFKEIQSKLSLESVKSEQEINDFLRKRGIPTAEFYRTLQGEYIWEYKGRVFHLQTFIDGVTYKMNTAPPWLINDLAAYHGKIHRELMEFPELKEEFGRRFFEEWEAKNTIGYYQDIMRKACDIEDEITRVKIIEDMEFKIALLPRIANFKFDRSEFTVSNSHGDYCIIQALCGEEMINAVVDFTGACRLPLCWEVIRSYTYADPECSNGRQINIENLKEYLRQYLCYNHLNSYDIKMMPYLYFYQVARSRFGYGEYFSLSQTKKEQLLDFAFWRTNMCRWLDKNVDLLAYELERNL